MIRILNVATPFHQGMELAPGDYEIEVSAAGHETQTRRVKVASGEDTRIDLRLSANKMDHKPTAPVQRPSIKQNDRFVNRLGMAFVRIKPGTFTMGQGDSIDGAHQVTLTREYFLQTTEVTQGQWKAVMGRNPSQFKTCGAILDGGRSYHPLCFPPPISTISRSTNPSKLVCIDKRLDIPANTK